MMFKTAVVFIHLIAMALAVGKILEFDVRFLLHARAPLTRSMLESLQLTKTVVTACLGVLWITGLALVGQGYLESPQYLDNQKLWVKAFVVLCLTVNGWALHHWAFPLLQGPTPFLGLPTLQIAGLAALASASSVSWMYASFLGIARGWNHTVVYSYPASIYVALLLAAWAGGAAALLWLSRARRPDFAETQPCPGLRG